MFTVNEQRVAVKASATAGLDAVWPIGDFKTFCIQQINSVDAPASGTWTITVKRSNTPSYDDGVALESATTLTNATIPAMTVQQSCAGFAYIVVRVTTQSANDGAVRLILCAKD